MSDDSRAPPLFRCITEPLALPKIATAPYRRPVLTEERGGGRPVLVLPGMASGDKSTALLRNSLAAAGYKPWAGGLGRNLTISPVKFRNLELRLLEMVGVERQHAIILGWSLGGFYARVLAQRHPAKVAMVATLGTPFSGHRKANHAWRIYEMLANHKVDAPPLPDDPAIKPAMHTIAFWSPVDGIVSPSSARGTDEERDEAIALPFRHFELGCSRRAVKQVVEALNERVALIEDA
ncbi:alpha/beta fold hydrolase [Altererythrobacter sp. HHU K3-1]|uniref:Alpha/beta fold hydrolase n=1 Tax=Qipengyuania atrilutea TaxID=2744473 RepID=A0A850GWG5_9SPHN|nr:alpha/beta fold hydrolase [Actirhodobacter atriluteus]